MIMRMTLKRHRLIAWPSKYSFGSRKFASLKYEGSVFSQPSMSSSSSAISSAAVGMEVEMSLL
jgi:hypothetical protein